MNKELSTNVAEVITTSVTVKVLQIGKKQLTLSAFRQIEEKGLESAKSIRWGIVRYKTDDHDLWLIYSVAGKLYRRKVYVNEDKYYVSTDNLHLARRELRNSEKRKERSDWNVKNGFGPTNGIDEELSDCRERYDEELKIFKSEKARAERSLKEEREMVMSLDQLFIAI